MKNKSKPILAILGIFFIIFFISFFIFGIWFYVNIHPLASFSTKSDCGLITEEELNDGGFMTAGKFSVDGNRTEIEIFVNDPEVVKHELCHKKQYEEGRLYTCETLFLRYINEAECYVKQKF